MALESHEIPYKKYNEPNYDCYYLDTDESTKGDIKFYTHIKKEDFSKKIPAYYKYLYQIRHEVYELNDTVIYYPGDTRYYPPPKKTYGQHGKVFMIRQEAFMNRDEKPFKFERNFAMDRVPLA